MAEISFTIEDQLEWYATNARHKERHEVLWHAWQQNKRWIRQLLEGVIISYPEYSRHDESHAQAVLHNIEMILGEDRIRQLSASDCFLILHTVYIHDIGMVITNSERKEVLKNEQFVEMIEEIEEDGDENQKKDVEVLKKSIYYYQGQDDEEETRLLFEDKLEVYHAVLRLVSTYRRREHGETSKKLLYEWTRSPEKLGSGFSLAGIPQRIFLAIADCASMHTKADMEEFMELPFEDNGYVFDYIHPRFASVLLMIGDLLDMDNDRFHPLTIIDMEENPWDSQIHYRKHMAVRKLHVCPDVIEIAADCDNQEALRLIRREGDMLIRILKQVGYAWASICPPGFPGALPNVRAFDLKLNQKKIPTELVTARFNISQKKAFDILEGINIYSSKFVFIREFLQNAIDATKLQYWKECKGMYGFYSNNGVENVRSPFELERYVTTESFPIEVEMEICYKDKDTDQILSLSEEHLSRMDEGKWTEECGVKVRIKDFGIGISQENLLSISKVGSSTTKKKKEIKDMPVWLRPTAEFGVGLQSAFIVVNYFKCYTHTRKEERYEITFGSGAQAKYNGYINVKPVEKKDLLDDTYGTCFEVFISADKKMRHEECPESWDGTDYFDDNYTLRKPVRHSAELMSQMALYLDSLVGEAIFPIHLTLKVPKGIEIPVNRTDKNRLTAVKYIRN